MNKKVISIIFIVFISSFCLTKNVYAADCGEVQKEINYYTQIKEDLSKLDCTITDDEKIVNSCNDLKLDKNALLTKIYHSQDDVKNCPSVSEKVEEILKENENDCGTVFNDTIDNFIKYVMGIFYIIGPILLILFGVLDFSRATVSSDQDALRKAGKKFSKRLIATLLLFMSPIIVRIILSFNTSGYELSGDAYVCNYSNSVYKKNYTIIYSPPKSDSGDDTPFSPDAEYVKWKQSDSKWKSVLLGATADTSLANIGCTTTAIAIQIAKSGVVSGSFDPGVLAKTIKSGGGYTSGGGIKWLVSSNAWQSIAPGFKYEKEVIISGDVSSKASQLSNYIRQGYYPVVEVKCTDNAGKCNTQHWVAAVAVQGNNIIFADPGSSSNDVVNNSKYTYSNPSKNKRVQLYKVE